MGHADREGRYQVLAVLRRHEESTWGVAVYVYMGIQFQELGGQPNRQSWECHRQCRTCPSPVFLGMGLRTLAESSFLNRWPTVFFRTKLSELSERLSSLTWVM